MTEEDIKQEVKSLKERVHTLEDEKEALLRLPEAVAELKGALGTLQELVLSRFDQVDGGVEKAASVKNAVQFAAIVIVPILVAVIGGYFALKAGGK